VGGERTVGDFATGAVSGRRPSPRPRKANPSRPPGSIRVVAGSAGGLRLVTPDGGSTRPTADRVREATFNALASLGSIDGARVLDAFAGSGALGIEALSRGAAHATFAEVAPAARAAVEANLRSTGLAAMATVVPGSAEQVAGGGPWDLVLLDPPYAYERWPVLLDLVRARLTPEAAVVVESDREIGVVAGLKVRWVRRYGGTVVTLVSPDGAIP
jgi:16S rRNA (guanine966-N2)-methyltransferase